MIVDCGHYRDGARQNDRPLEIERAAELAGGDGEFVWLGLHEPDAAELGRAQRAFGLHELAVEDASGSHQRPKIEDYDGSYFIVLHSARYIDATEEVEFGEIHIFAAPGYVIAVRRGDASPLTRARRRLEASPELMRHGAAAAVWAIVDEVVDAYEPVAAGLENDITEVEEQVFAEDADPTQRIYFLKREVIAFHRALAPLIAPLERIERGGPPAVSDELRPFFRDIADHARRVDEQVNSQRELLTSILEANLALQSVRQNEVVRKISAYAALIAVPTFLASVYGMNFDHMPELDWSLGYPLVLVVMAAVVATLYRFFRRAGWL